MRVVRDPWPGACLRTAAQVAARIEPAVRYRPAPIIHSLKRESDEIKTVGAWVAEPGAGPV
jgi:hypothetical protein